MFKVTNKLEQSRKILEANIELLKEVEDCLKQRYTGVRDARIRVADDEERLKFCKDQLNKYEKLYSKLMDDEN